jgi:hypothetical protein
MEHFTQLNLQGKPEQKPAQNFSKTNLQAGASGQRPAAGTPVGNKSPKKLSGLQRNMALAASFAAVALIGATFLETSGCSKAAKTTIQPPMSQTTSTATLQPSAPAPSSAAVMPAKKLAKKKVRAKIPVATYRNSEYGISFRYPKYDTLKLGNDAKVEWTGMGPVPMNFTQPGGTILSTVALPDDLYPGTDFAAGFLTATVNPKMSAADCEQFSSTTPSGAEKPVAPSKVKLGKTEFSEVETLAGNDKQADAKYFHVFQNGACYEFALGLQTASGEGIDGTAPVNRNQVFHKLEWMLSTVKINSVEAAKTTPSAPAATPASVPATTAPAASTPTIASPASVSATPAVKVIDDRQ